MGSGVTGSRRAKKCGKVPGIGWWNRVVVEGEESDIPAGDLKRKHPQSDGRTLLRSLIKLQIFTFDTSSYYTPTRCVLVTEEKNGLYLQIFFLVVNHTTYDL